MVLRSITNAESELTRIRAERKQLKKEVTVQETEFMAEVRKAQVTLFSLLSNLTIPQFPGSVILVS